MAHSYQRKATSDPDFVSEEFEGGAGGGAATTPTWDYSASAPTAGQFQPNDVNPGNTTAITISATSKNSLTGNMGVVGAALIGTYMAFVNTATGATTPFSITAVSGSLPNTWTVTPVGNAGETSWGTEYSIVSFGVQAVIGVADGTYTVGIGTTTNGTITISQGRIIGIQEAT